MIEPISSFVFFFFEQISRRLFGQEKEKELNRNLNLNFHNCKKDTENLHVHSQPCI